MIILESVTLFGLVATAYRLIAWIKEPTIWRSASFGAYAAMTIAWVSMVAHTSIDSWTGSPHLARLIGYLAGMCAAGAANIHLLGLRTVETRRRAVGANVMITLALSGMVIICWLVAPGHDVESPGIALSLPVALFNTGLLYLAYTCLLGMIINAQVVRRSGAVSHRVGGTVSAAGFAFGIVMMVAVVARFYSGYFFPEALQLLNLTCIVIPPFVLTGLAGGTFMLAASAQLAGWLDAVRVFVALAPLWRLAIRRHPDVALPLRGLGVHPSMLRLLAFRIRVEILDALGQTHVPQQLLDRMEAPQAIVHALIYPAVEGRFASQLVSGTDEEITAELAAAYRRSAQIKAPIRSWLFAGR